MMMIILFVINRFDQLIMDKNNIYNYNIYMEKLYCVKCKTKREVKHVKIHRPAKAYRVSAVCVHCGSKVSSFIKKPSK